MIKIIKTMQTIIVEAIRELPLRIIPIIFLLTCGAPEQKETKPSFEPVKIKGRIQIDEIKYSGPPAQSWIVAGIRDTVTNDLAKVREVEAISIDDQNKALKMIAERRKAGEKNLDPSKESAKILAADYLCVGNLQNTGKVLRLNIRLLKAPDFSAEQTSTIDGTLDEIFTLQDKVVESLLANVDAKMKPDERLVIEVFTPKNKKAYELYAQGLEIRNTNPKKALDLFLEALNMEPDYLDVINWIGIQYESLSQYEKALEYHNKRKKLLEDKRLSNHREYAKTLVNIGVVYDGQSKYAEALDYYCKAQKIYEDLGLKKTLSYAGTLNNIGVVFDSQGKYAEALDYYFQCNKINEDTKSLEYAITLSNIGMVYNSQGQYEEALKYLSQSKKIKEDLGLGKTASYATTLNNIGNVHGWSLGNYEEAKDHLFRSKKILEDIGLGKSYGYASTLNNIGSTYYKKGEFCISTEWYKKAIFILEQIGVSSEKVRSFFNIAQEECNASKRR
ncbi:MAG: tetratricopeptide repeat protein [Leptospiraceae bacterium]|nr:tetratricopeptide repeat protein [Leptospiraceae bacterium]